MNWCRIVEIDNIGQVLIRKDHGDEQEPLISIEVLHCGIFAACKLGYDDDESRDKAFLELFDSPAGRFEKIAFDLRAQARVLAGIGE